jgi:hypothetical protein
MWRIDDHRCIVERHDLPRRLLHCALGRQPDHNARQLVRLDWDYEGLRPATHADPEGVCANLGLDQQPMGSHAAEPRDRLVAGRCHAFEIYDSAQGVALHNELDTRLLLLPLNLLQRLDGDSFAPGSTCGHFGAQPPAIDALRSVVSRAKDRSEGNTEATKHRKHKDEDQC